MIKLSEIDKILNTMFSEFFKLPNWEQQFANLAETYNFRCNQLVKFGFFEFTVENLIADMMGQHHNFVVKKDFTFFEYVYNHHTKLETKICRKENVLFGLKKRRLLNWPPMSFDVLWEVKHIKLNDLDNPHPALILRVLETKPLLLFNAYSVLVSEKIKKVVLLGNVWELPNSNNIGRISYFYLGEWGLR